MTAISSRSKNQAFALLLIIQTLAAIVIVSSTIPIYIAIFAAPGYQLAHLPQSPVALIAALLLFHCTYWFRLTRVPVVVRWQNHVASHVVLFVARLSFIFGTAFFALIAFRHLPSLHTIEDPMRLAMRIFAAIVILFSLYCYSAELERLGVALRPSLRD